jgi:hypothetical protein
VASNYDAKESSACSIGWWYSGIPGQSNHIRKEATMRRPKDKITGGEDLFIGIDLHKIRWHVTIRTLDLELFNSSIPGNWEALHRVLARYHGHPLQAVYEAGYFGFWLHDRWWIVASPV